MRRPKNTTLMVTHAFPLTVRFTRSGDWWLASATLPNGKEFDLVHFTRKEVIADLIELLEFDGYKVSRSGRIQTKTG